MSTASQDVRVPRVRKITENAAATASDIQHQPWCNHHLDADPNNPDDAAGNCTWERKLGDLLVSVDEDGNGGPPLVAVYGRDDSMTPQRAREVAAALLQAADLAQHSA